MVEVSAQARGCNWVLQVSLLTDVLHMGVAAAWEQNFPVNPRPRADTFSRADWQAIIHIVAGFNTAMSPIGHDSMSRTPSWMQASTCEPMRAVLAGNDDV